MIESEAAVGFILLSNGPQPSGTELATQTIGDVEGRPLLLAVDAHGCRHLLVETQKKVRSDLRSRALKVAGRTLVIDGDNRVFVDLWCSDLNLGNLFERVVDDILGRLTDGADPNTVCHMALEDWRDLLHAARAGTSLEDAIGLIGELEILGWLADATSPADALASWWGPERHVHDFYSQSNKAVEVKTTQTLDGNRVTISNLDQLDPLHLKLLWLAVVHVRPDTTAPSLDDRIRKLIGAGINERELVAKVADSGHVFDVPTTIDTRFGIRTVRLWQVGETFPGLRRSGLTDHILKGVSNVRFELNLDTAGDSLNESQIRTVFDEWGGQ